MVRYNIGGYIKVIVVLSIALFLALTFFRNNFSFKNIYNILGNITTTITIVTAICILFGSYAWKWSVFQGWLVPFPCLSGKWDGKLISTYNSENKSIPIEVTIKHKFLNIQIQVKTNESASTSICGSFDIDEDRGLKQLFYSYQNTPRMTIRAKSEIHYGTVRLKINEDATVLEGEYWTTRKTTGDINIRKVIKN